MSREEQAAVIGGRVLDYAENKRRRALLACELDRYGEAFRLLAKDLSHSESGEIDARTVRRDLEVCGLDLKRLARFVDEYIEAGESLNRGAALLREFGV